MNSTQPKFTNLVIPFSASAFHSFVHLVPDHLLSFLETLRILPHRHRWRHLVVGLDRMPTGSHLRRSPVTSPPLCAEQTRRRLQFVVLETDIDTYKNNKKHYGLWRSSAGSAASPPRRSVETFDLQNLTRSSVGASEYFQSVLTKLFKAFMRHHDSVRENVCSISKNVKVMFLD